MNAQNQMKQLTNILGESLVFETFSKLLHVEKEKCSKKIDRLKSELSQYEKEFSMKSEETWEGYRDGTSGDGFDVMEWMALYENLIALKEQYDRITNIDLS